ncbi:ABC transporter ATP-binding protein [Gallibacterium salpingitidis]|uniref:Sugar ABC transporter ATP-binding protein n=1 Tax=Gallibacterium salpingitidis TaxID=505341 RepID=A0A1A7P0D2_9PAST|nr:ABC transporter ATP-binding protein [Gallibacterium salpingitidis]OBW95290.1 sugar ABC transporter ATP-binding protein [Gallibacterium salpingitidis]
MSDTILSVHNIGKAYRTYRNEFYRILSWFGINTNAKNETWTLKNINFSIKPGEAVGIIGQNGAGKSTLLKIITGTLKPTTGKISVNGKISAILELGMGFHPDLTGRQNVYHSAGLMGYTYENVDQVINDIEEFAEIGEYFDQPVRLYSSGMQVRVAFAVATAFRPEILIVDEALSVGDAYFQHKSFEKIREFREQGTSLLFVSHDKAAILSLCDRAILLDKGIVIKDGEPEEVTDYYNALIAQKSESTSNIKQEKLSNGSIATISGTGEATVKEISLRDKYGDIVETVGVGDDVMLKIIVEVREDLPTLVLGYGIKDRLGQVIFGTNTYLMKQVLHNVRKNELYEFNINFPANFGLGSYSIQTALVDKDTHLTANYEWRDMALMFSVININKNQFAGLMWNEPKIEINRII